tara:strand:+ start:1644 stop:3623 length:1980 start_codon:yes stop_codon:yes gene_type:complete
MFKIKIANFATDTLLREAGRARILTSQGTSASQLQNSPEGVVKISVTSSMLREEGENIYEVAKIKVETVDKSRETILNFLAAESLHTNYNTSVPKLIDLNENKDMNITKASPTFSIDSTFNYIATDYDKVQASFDEVSMLSSIDKSSKNDILNFRKLKKSNISNYSRGTSMKNFVVPQKTAPSFMEEAPYYIRIGINDNVSGNLSQFLQKISIYDEVLTDYLSSNKQEVQMNLQDGTIVMENETVGMYELSSFFDSEVQIDYDNFHGINELNEVSRMSLDLRKHLLKGYIKNSSKIGFRTFEEVINGHECHKEAFCYSVEKYDEFETEGAKIQTLFAPAGYDHATILDTQVKYGKAYIYKAKSHYLVVGNTYRYTNVRMFKDDDNYYATADVINEPSLMLVPFDLFNERKAIIQPPPVAPQVSFKTENNSSKQIQVYLSPTKSEIEQPFVEVLESDEAQLVKMQEFFKGGDTYRFATTSQTGLYEAFRTEHPPLSYKDFANKKLSEVRMTFRDTNAIFLDNIESNKDYYYMFRKINDKGLVSNPTAVFKVRLVVDADDATVMVDTHMFPKKDKFQPRMSFKSMLQVKPSVEQYLFNEEQKALSGKTSLKGTISELQLGVSPRSVWGRKFKLRVRSKTSGKIIDLNINFELSKNKTKEEF